MPEISGYNPTSASVALARRSGQGENSGTKILQVDRLRLGDPQKNENSLTQDGLRTLKGSSGTPVYRGTRSEPLGGVNNFETSQGSTGLKLSTSNPTAFGGLDGPARLDRDAFFPSESSFKVNRSRAIQMLSKENEPIDNLQTEKNSSINQFAERVDRSINTLNKRMEDLNRAIRFSRDKESNIDVITVVNPDNGDVVRQIPPEYAIRVSEGLKSMRGLLFDDKA